MPAHRYGAWQPGIPSDTVVLDVAHVFKNEAPRKDQALTNSQGQSNNKGSGSKTFFVRLLAFSEFHGFLGRFVETWCPFFLARNGECLPIL